MRSLTSPSWRFVAVNRNPDGARLAWDGEVPFIRLKANSLQACTSEVHGDPDVHPKTEAYWGRVNPMDIRSCYDERKRCAETLFFDYWRQHQLRIKIVRIFNTYDPKMQSNDGRIVCGFIVQALKGGDISIYGDRAQTRSFCYVDDVIDTLMRAVDTRDQFVGPVNVGNPSEFSILNLAQKVILLTGSMRKLIFGPLPQDDPGQRQPSIHLAKRQLEWFPRVEPMAGLQQTIANFSSIGVNSSGNGQ